MSAPLLFVVESGPLFIFLSTFNDSVVALLLIS